MTTAELILRVVKAIVEVAGFAYLGQGIVAIFAGGLRETNLFYKILKTVTNPVTVVLNGDLTVQANFAEVFTTNHPTPHWWLAQYGYTNDLENTVTQIGANGFALWQSYIAGLDPNDPGSQLRLHLELSAHAPEPVLRGGHSAACPESWLLGAEAEISVTAAVTASGRLS